MHAVVQTTSRVHPRVVIVGSGVSGLLVAQFLVGVEAEVVVLRQAMHPHRQRQFERLDTEAPQTAKESSKTKSLSKMNRAELEAVAAEIRVDASWYDTNKSLIEAIKHKQSAQ